MKHLSGVTALACLCAPALAATAIEPAHAQSDAAVSPAAKPATSRGSSAAAPADTASSDKGVAEIVVTAQREAQNILAVPLSVTAVTGRELTNLGVHDISTLQFLTPGFVPTQHSDSTLIFVRGIGNGLFTGADPSVATYVDDVPRVYGQLVNALVDVERIELLKGAQGGLYGRNATGGVLNIITRQPSTDGFSGDIRTSYGTRDTFKFAGNINVPLGPNAAFSLSGYRDTHGYYDKNIVTSTTPYTAAMFPTGSYVGTPQQTAAFFNSGVNPPKGYDNRNLWAVYGKLLFRPSSQFKITLAGDYSYHDDDESMQAVQFNPGYMQGVLQSFFASFGINAVLPPNFVYSTNDKFALTKSVASRNRLKSYGGSATEVLSLDQVDVTSITAYRENDAFAFDELGDINVPLINNTSSKKAHFLYQELRATTTSSGPFHIIAGATYLDNHFAQDSESVIIPPLYSEGLTSSLAITKNYSVYGQVRYDLTGALNLTASGRYIHETNNTVFSSPTASASGSSVNKFLPSATLSYGLGSGGNVYARWARGFKGGGVNPVVPPSDFPTRLGSVFGPETVDTYEVGLRTRLANNAVQLTSAVFYNDYRNLQVSTGALPQYPAIIYAIVNAGTARTWGAEASVTWRVAPVLTLGSSGGYLNAKYLDFQIPAGNVLEPFNQSGQRMHNAPKFQFSQFADLNVPITDRLKITGNALAAYTSSILYSYSGAPGILPDGVQKGFWLANMRAGLATRDDRYHLTAYVENLFNKYYFTYIASTGSTGNYGTAGNPRVVGVELAAKF